MNKRERERESAHWEYKDDKDKIQENDMNLFEQEIK